MHQWLYSSNKQRNSIFIKKKTFESYNLFFILSYLNSSLSIFCLAFPVSLNICLHLLQWYNNQATTIYHPEKKSRYFSASCDVIVWLFGPPNLGVLLWLPELRKFHMHYFTSSVDNSGILYYYHPFTDKGIKDIWSVYSKTMAYFKIIMLTIVKIDNETHVSFLLKVDLFHNDP